MVNQRGEAALDPVAAAAAEQLLARVGAAVDLWWSAHRSGLSTALQDAGARYAALSNEPLSAATRTGPGPVGHPGKAGAVVAPSALTRRELPASSRRAAIGVPPAAVPVANGPPPALRHEQVGKPDSAAVAVQTRAAPVRAAGDLGEELRDTRLMLQIGLALGLAYLGFLCLWFWATRLRPGAPRARF